MKKRIISFVLIMVMAIGFMPTLTFAANTTEFAGGSGTEADPYLISTKTHLNNVRNYLNAHFKMIADIEFTDADFAEGGDFYNDGQGFAPIGNQYFDSIGNFDNRFKGTFDGNGFTIKNLYINISSSSDTVYAGLFGYNKGTIKNLGLVDGSISTSGSSSYTGGIAGYTFEGTITNCYNTGSVSASSSSSFSRAGGIVGHSYEGTISNCYNTGSVSASTSYSRSSSYAGGILGRNKGTTIENCYNTGSVSATSSSSSSFSYAGGITGEDSNTISNCYNTGSVFASSSASTSYSHAGGITGDSSGTISNCYNTGSVSASASSSDSSSRAGGITGSNIVGTIENCYNTGSVYTTSLDSESYAGGIAGRSNGKIVTNCYNTGNVSASYTSSSSSPLSYAGGIIGRNIESTIINCYNTGSVSATSSSSCAGGIAGCSDPGTIENCFNTGDVSAESSTGTACTGGIAGGNGSTIENCYNIGSISASGSSSYTGGIAGSNYNKITNCYNTGNVSASVTATATASSSYAGGIAGYNNTTYNAIKNCYYIDNISKGVGSGSAAATKCTSEQMKLQSTFVGFDFENIWEFAEENIYPYPTLKNNKYFLSDENTEFAGGSGTEEDPYLIRNKYHLNNVRNYLDAHFKMTADIEFTASDFAEGGDFYNGGQGWTPIGSRSSAFAGTFDGNGYIIKNLYINITSSKTVDAGVFGYNTGTIKNLGITDSVVQATSSTFSAYVGGIAGFNHGGTITNCYNTGSVSASTSSYSYYDAYAGGIAGKSYEGSITYCYNTGEVTSTSAGKSYAGGIVGENDYDSTIENCFNTGSVTANSSGKGVYEGAYAAGIAARNDFKITQCYNIGVITATSVASYSGGIVGSNNGDISKCYNLCDVSAINTFLNDDSYNNSYSGGITGYNRQGGTISNCYNTGSIVASSSADETYSYAGGIAGLAMYVITNCYSVGPVSASLSAGGIVGISKSATITNCYYLDLISVGSGDGDNSSTKCTAEQMKLQSTFVGFDFENVWTFDSNPGYYSFPVLKEVGHVYISDFAGGSGTEADPYLIETKYHLNNVRNYPDAHFKMIADIEFTEADFAEGGDFYNDGQGWEPIGNYSYPFTGTFDGNGFTIKNLYVNISSGNNVRAGLFGYVNSGTIKNLGVLDGNISVSSTIYNVYASGVVAYNEDGTISNCYNTGTVFASSSSSNGYTYAGGIVAWNQGTILDCHNSGVVSATGVSYVNAGGITGPNYYGTISNCYNTGSVSSSSQSYDAFAGGIAGSGSSISNCYNTGDVSATVSSSSNNVYAYAGGIAGSGSTISNCYNTGNISVTASSESGHAYAYAGGITGSNGGTIGSCYNKGDISSSSTFLAYAGGVSGCNSDIIKTCHNTGKISATALLSTSGAYAGGIVGYNENEGVLDDTEGVITDCYSTGDIYALNKSTYSYDPALAGGIAGSNDGTINTCYNTGCVYADSSSESFAGGITGSNSGTIGNCYNTGCVSSKASSTADVGGIAGTNSGTINTCYSIGDVSSSSQSDKAYAGGIVGNIYTGTISNCYNTGAVSTTSQSDDAYAGGIAGKSGEQRYENSVISNCYNIGIVSAVSTSSKAYAGGIVGFNQSTIKNCYFIDNVSSGVGLNWSETTTIAVKCTATQFKEKSTFAGFDFESVWTMQGSDCYAYPKLQQLNFVTDHFFDNACDPTCNCGYVRTVPNHNYSDYTYNNDATEQKDGTKTRTCSVCGHKETIIAEGTKLEKTLVDSSKMFIDVPAKKWFKQYVDYSVTYGIFSGTSANTFSPNDNITRAQFVQVLANLEGVDTSNRNISSGFTDVPKGKWYTAAVTWAAKNGIVNGVGAGKFDPNANVTREQMCVMLTNYAKFKGITLKAVEAKENFADDGKISKWAKDAVYICQQADIVNGKGAGMFDPKGTGTRAEACVIFTKFHKDFVA